ncbi:hypothetical protein EJ110_NYTH55680 [Nymphaea thermarum]|nr:hypothetical protein EJ110_NYTH55680 [Nymphaea thermarum]
MLRGRASLVRLIGRRRRLSDSSFSPPADDASDRRKIQTKSNGESSSYVNKLSSAHTVDHSKLEDDENVEQDLDWVTCPVCGKSIRCIHDIVNSHLGEIRFNAVDDHKDIKGFRRLRQFSLMASYALSGAKSYGYWFRYGYGEADT